MKQGRAISYLTYYSITRRAQLHNLTAAKLGLKRAIWPYELLDLWQDQDYRCDNCRSELAWRNIQIKYIILPADGGDNVVRNLRLTCGRCK